MKTFTLHVQIVASQIVRPKQIRIVGGDLFSIYLSLDGKKGSGKEKQESLFLNIDFEKTYDCIHLGFILEILK